jgi:Transposase DDE domain group 1
VVWGAYPRKSPSGLGVCLCDKSERPGTEGHLRSGRYQYQKDGCGRRWHQVVAHAGLHVLGRFADEIGVGETLSSAFPWTGERAPGHDRGKVLTHVMLMLTSGGESCADIEQLRIQDELFGDVCSDSTVHRAFHQITPTVLADLAACFATVRTGCGRSSPRSPVTA